MAPSHKDWELPNSRIWLVVLFISIVLCWVQIKLVLFAEMDIDRGLDFPIYTGI